MEYTHEIFAKSFLLTRKWEQSFNRTYKEEGLTLKQMMLLIVLNHNFMAPPTIKEIAESLSTSHQNVKAIVMQLDKKGFVSVFKDSDDKRVTRVSVCEGKEEFWAKRNTEDEKILAGLFEGVSSDALEVTLGVINKLYENAEKKEADC